MVSAGTPGRALLTGGTGTLGWAMTRALCAAGWQVVFTARDAARASALCAAPEARGRASALWVGDLGDASALAEVCAVASGADLVVASAGMSPDQLLLDTPDAAFDECFAVNLRAAWALAQAQARGIFVGIGSLSGEGAPANAAYAASKGALAGLVAGLAAEGRLRPFLLVPGFVPSQMTQSLRASSREALEQASPLGRAGRPEEVAAALVYLALHADVLPPGHILRVTGGLLETPR